MLDTFTAGSGASVKARASDSGATWSSLGAADMTVTAAGRAFFAQNGYMYLTAPEQGRHQYIERDIDVVSSGSALSSVLMRARTDATGYTGYLCQFNPSTLLVNISRVSNGNSTLLVSATIADPGSNYTIRGEANGPFLTMSIGPKGGPLTQLLSTIDGVYWQGAVGVRDSANANATATTGRQTDAVRAGNLAAA
jgi:hypothetical protein